MVKNIEKNKINKFNMSTIQEKLAIVELGRNPNFHNVSKAFTAMYNDDDDYLGLVSSLTNNNKHQK